MQIFKKEIIEKARLRIQADGTVFVLKKVLKDALRPIFLYDRLLFFHKDLNKDDINAYRLDDNCNLHSASYANSEENRYEFVVFTRENVNGYRGQLQYLMKRKKVNPEEWLNEGKYCFACLDRNADGAKIVGYVWLTLRARYPQYMGKNYFAKEEACAHTGFILPEHRRKKIATRIFSNILVFSKQQNLKRLNIFVVDDNLKSIKAFAVAFKFKRSDRLAHYIRIFNKERYFVHE